MNLRNRKGDEFRLKIIGYQFPDILDKYWDSNWLNVQMSGNNAVGSWSVEDSCLLTFEVESLASWLVKIPSDKILKFHINFTEPSPQFRLIQHKSGNRLLRVDLGYIFRKKLSNLFGERKTVHWYFPLNEIDLPRQAHLLREQLKNYPQRVFR